MAFAWWVYVVAALTAFFCGVVLNYIVKKVNEIRLEERINRLHNKASQSTQVQGPLIEMETKISKPLENIIANSNKGISLVFKKEETVDDDTRVKEVINLKTSLSNATTLRNVSIRESSLIKSNNTSKSNIPRRIASNELKSRNVLSNSSSKKEINDKSGPTVDDIEKPTFLGNIYKKDLSKTKAKSKCSIMGSEGSFKEVVDKIIGNMNESKSTPSIHKLYDLQNDKDMRRWISDIVLKSKCATDSESTSSNK